MHGIATIARGELCHQGAERPVQLELRNLLTNNSARGLPLPTSSESTHTSRLVELSRPSSGPTHERYTEDDGRNVTGPSIKVGASRREACRGRDASGRRPERQSPRELPRSKQRRFWPLHDRLRSPRGMPDPRVLQITTAIHRPRYEGRVP